MKRLQSIRKKSNEGESRNGKRGRLGVSELYSLCTWRSVSVWSLATNDCMYGVHDVHFRTSSKFSSNQSTVSLIATSSGVNLKSGKYLRIFAFDAVFLNCPSGPNVSNMTSPCLIRTILCVYRGRARTTNCKNFRERYRFA